MGNLHRCRWWHCFDLARIQRCRSISLEPQVFRSGLCLTALQTNLKLQDNRKPIETCLPKICLWIMWTWVSPPCKQPQWQSAIKRSNQVCTGHWYWWFRLSLNTEVVHSKHFMDFLQVGYRQLGFVACSWFNYPQATYIYWTMTNELILYSKGLKSTVVYSWISNRTSVWTIMQVLINESLWSCTQIIKS